MELLRWAAFYLRLALIVVLFGGLIVLSGMQGLEVLIVAVGISLAVFADITIIKKFTHPEEMSGTRGMLRLLSAVFVIGGFACIPNFLGFVFLLIVGVIISVFPKFLKWVE